MTNPDRPCAPFRDARRISRRQALEAGGLGLLGLGLADLWAGRAIASPRVSRDASQPAGFGRAKACIFIFMWGGPSQLDTFDLKPNAPAEVRGEFNPISTRVPGMQICEHFGMVSQVAEKLAIIRSLHHTDPAHLSSGHLALTGHLAPVINSDAEPPSDRDTPHLGSVVARLSTRPAALPPFVSMPWLAYHPAAPGGRAPGQNAGWLGHKFDPLVLTGDPNDAKWKVRELGLPDDIPLARLESRRSLLGSIDVQRAALGATAASGVGAYKQQAFGLLGSQEARRAFDLSQEPEQIRERYGRNIHGQCVLLARRLIEHGVPLVSVNWHNDGQNFWDTHQRNFIRLKSDLIPPSDRALSALLEDLDGRGLLDETIVAWVGEFGRCPRINSASAGREHWPRCYSGLLAGGGIRGGAVYGASDAQAAHPAEHPVSPQDYSATIFHALGIAPHGALEDRFGRPIRICEGTPITGLFG